MPGFQDSFRISIALGAMAGMALSHRLWLSARAYPLTPAVPGLHVPAAVGLALFVLTLAALAGVLWSARMVAVFAALAVVLVVLDQSRLQPWFYEYVFLLGGAALGAPNACRLIVATVYFWSGIQKLNPMFTGDVFPWMMEPFVKHAPVLGKIVGPMGAAAPWMEAMIGLALLHRSTRKAGVVAALAMHAFILLSIGPLGQNANNVVWPWNFAMAAAVVILFWKSDARVLKYEGWYQIVALLVFAIAPLMSFFGYWDHYLSAAMYSGNREEATIFFPVKTLEKLPEAVQDEARVETNEIDSIDVSEWSMDELNVPPYPETRIYKNIARTLCGYGDVTLSVTSKRVAGQRVVTTKSYTCSGLKDGGAPEGQARGR